MDGEAFVVGDVFEATGGGHHRWRVERVLPDGRAVLRSVATEWATTRPLTWAENAENFRLVQRDGRDLPAPEVPTASVWTAEDQALLDAAKSDNDAPF